MKSDRYTNLSEINVTSLVDVTLVLLIVFIITAPLLKSGMEVELPQTVAREIDPVKSIQLAVTSEGEIFWDNEKISINILRDRLEKRKASDRLEPILLKGDKEALYGYVIDVMDLLKELQIEKVGLVLKPKQR